MLFNENKMPLPKVIKDLIEDYHEGLETVYKYNKVVEQIEHNCKWMEYMKSGKTLLIYATTFRYFAKTYKESMLTLALTFRHFPRVEFHSLTDGASMSIAGFVPPSESWSYLEGLRRHGISPDDPGLRL